MIKWVLRILFLLIVIAVVAIVGFAYLGNLDPDQQDISEPVELNGS